MTSASSHKRLIIYVGRTSERPGAVAGLFERLRTVPGYGDDETIYWEFPDPVRRFSRAGLAAHARDLADRIDSYRIGLRRTREVVLIGHGVGGLLVRYAYLQARCGIDGPALAWAQAVTRIVLLATPNRGFDPARLAWPQRILLWLFAPLLRRYTIAELVMGTPFVTNLRIQWMREFAELGHRAPKVVQLRADDDVTVADEDSRDLEALPTGTQRVMPLATHDDIVAVDSVREDYPGQRFDILCWAITEPIQATEPTPVPPSEAIKKSVVFVLHGIRSGSGDWPAELAEQLADHDHAALVVTPSYGRLSAYDFALPFTRRRNLRWFADQYSYYLARHPGKPFHFVGHSNGTYLFGQSLKQIPALRFDHVFLAGSVLPREYDWLRATDRGQVGELVNVCASADKPVGWLCSALRGFGMRDIGVGGFTGFDSVPPNAVQVRSIQGGHGAALVPQRLASIADYVRTGKCAPETDLVTPTETFGMISRFAPIGTWLAAGTLAGLGWLSVLLIGGTAGAALILALLLVTYVVLKVA
ncbi:MULTISPECIES: hypothetical protein [unclassified Nocardia]|uniref:hypothetical protein n=1 Tax=unclassified Nocardia TaxID=2637762 RepID=UPI001CE3FFD5|nr:MULTISPECIES: hypothetical protein [unclassified Nocardia]